MKIKIFERLLGGLFAATCLTVISIAVSADEIDDLDTPDNSTLKKMSIKDLKMNFVLVEPAPFEFTMPPNCRKPRSIVTFSKPYWIGTHEVTQAQFKAVTGKNPSKFKGDNLPVENITRAEAVEFCRKLTEREHQQGTLPKNCVYRLPTEAEWEFAAKGGKYSKGYTYSGSNDATKVGWIGANSGGKTHPVGSRKPNELGIYDMTGNVFEWCRDWFGPLPSGQVKDYEYKKVHYRGYIVNRGGCYLNHPRFCTNIYRNCTIVGERRKAIGSFYVPICADSIIVGERYETIGFRVVRTSK